MNDNFRVLETFSGRLFDPAALAHLRRWSDARHAALSPLIARRAREGRAVHGHGDLHLAHIYVNGGVEILDCTEFARRYRVGDVFLARFWIQTMAQSSTKTTAKAMAVAVQKSGMR